MPRSFPPFLEFFWSRRKLKAHLGRARIIVAFAEDGHHGDGKRGRKLFEQGGSSFTVFVLNERLARVRRMLPEERYAHLTIAQIAHACGFNDISYFNRAFRRQFGGTPTDVREACARQN